MGDVSGYVCNEFAYFLERFGFSGRRISVANFAESIAYPVDFLFEFLAQGLGKLGFCRRHPAYAGALPYKTQARDGVRMDAGSALASSHVILRRRVGRWGSIGYARMALRRLF